jgi:large subunit ribosomal protein L4
MAKIDVYNLDRKKVSELSLDDTVFGAEVKDHLLYSVVRYQLAKRRQGTHKTKVRSEVSGGGKKPWKQKGTGRARHGSTRSPQWRGGGVVFGPTPRSYAFKLNKKVRAAALRSAISRRFAENALIVLDTLALRENKTREVAAFLERFELADAIVVAPSTDDAFRLSARNIQAVTVVPPEGLNVYDILRRRAIVMTPETVAAISARLGG